MLGAKANRAAKQTSPELIARGFFICTTGKSIAGLHGGHHSTEYEAKCDAFLLSTTFLKAHPTKYQTDKTLTLSAVATVLCALQEGLGLSISQRKIYAAASAESGG